MMMILLLWLHRDVRSHRFQCCLHKMCKVTNIGFSKKLLRSSEQGDSLTDLWRHPVCFTRVTCDIEAMQYLTSTYGLCGHRTEWRMAGQDEGAGVFVAWDGKSGDPIERHLNGVEYSHDDKQKDHIGKGSLGRVSGFLACTRWHGERT